MAEKKGAGGEDQSFDPKTGKYGSGGGKSDDKAKTIEAIKKYSDDPTKDIAEYGGLEEASKPKIENNVSPTTLSKSEWKRYYDTIGDIKAGTVQEHKTPKGNRWVILNSNELTNNTKTPARILIDNGKYVSPKVKTVLTFNSDDDLYNFIDD